MEARHLVQSPLVESRSWDRMRRSDQGVKFSNERELDYRGMCENKPKDREDNKYFLFYILGSISTSPPKPLKSMPWCDGRTTRCLPGPDKR